MASINSQSEEQIQENHDLTQRKNHEFNEVEFGHLEVHLDNVQKPEWSTESLAN